MEKNIFLRVGMALAIFSKKILCLSKTKNELKKINLIFFCFSKSLINDLAPLFSELVNIVICLSKKACFRQIIAFVLLFDNPKELRLLSL